jgi:nitrile hydratase
MNGVHDMGGLQDFGPVVPEADEPKFHHPWERRAFALTLAMGGTGTWNLDQTRAARESLPPAQYLASSYYQIWLEGLRALLLERGLVTTDELADGRLREPARTLPRVLTADRVASALARGSPTLRTVTGAARFRVGDRVRTRNLHPPTHTRLPRYCRGRAGTIASIHGAHVFADAHARGVGEQPQWLYTVRFAASELWGAETTANAVHVDCWESYLEAG